MKAMPEFSVPSIRRRRVAAAVARAGAEGLLVTHLPDVRYLSGFTGSNAAMLVQGSKGSVFATLFTDGRYEEQARSEVDGARVDLVIVTEKSAAIAACESAVAKGLAVLAFDSVVTTIATLNALRAVLPPRLRKSFLLPVDGLIAALRQIKDEVEQDKMRTAAELGCRLFDGVLEHIVPGATEMEVAMALEYMARLEGAESMAFETIVAGGQRSALPHGRATNAKLPRRGFVTLDFGVMLDGYCSDMTRTVHMGSARKDELEIYDAVLAAQKAGVAAVRPGVTGAEVDAAARNVLVAAGLGDFFPHATGHGVGLEIHEAPRLGRNGMDQLKAGMIVTIEPGAYLPGRFGVRIEDTMLVTAKGCEILTPSTKAWIEL